MVVDDVAPADPRSAAATPRRTEAVGDGEPASEPASEVASGLARIAIVVVVSAIGAELGDGRTMAAPAIEVLELVVHDS